MTKQPQNWQELQAAAKQEIRNKIVELEERIEAMQRLCDRFEAVNWDNPGGLVSDAAMYGDMKDMKYLNSISTFWPDVKSVPGEGYW